MRQRKGLIVLAVLASLLAAGTVVGALTCFIAAIWVYGPNSMRLGGTGTVLAFLSIPTVAAAVFAWAVVTDG